MASSIDKNSQNSLLQHDLHTQQPKDSAPSPKERAASKVSIQPAPQESFSSAKEAKFATARPQQPMLGAFAAAPAKPQAKAPATQGPSTLLEQQQVLNAANNIMAKTMPAKGLAQKTAGSVGMGALGVSLAAPFLALPAAIGAVAVASGASLLARRSARQAVSNSVDLQGDVDVLKAARDRISKVQNPSQLERATLNAAQKGLAHVKS